MIRNIPYLHNNNYHTYLLKKRQVSFCGGTTPLEQTNLGKCPEGYIGKVNVSKNNQRATLNVFKENLSEHVENYTFKNNANETIGNINLFIIKPLNRWGEFDTGYIMVDELRNYSNPNSAFHNHKLEEYKNVGIRLMQLALKRSYEERCDGNIKLVPLTRATNWYINIIGMKLEKTFDFVKSGVLFLPQESKEALLKLRGGLCLTAR